MKKSSNNFILAILLFIFIISFKYSSLIHTAVIDSCILWFKKLMPFMFVMYTLTDLLINYGLSQKLYRFFKNNTSIVFIISMLLGTPANAKYIRDFYKNNYITESEANYLLTYAYSPNPLFIIGIAPSKKWAVLILGFIYFSNIVIALIFRKIKFREEVASSKFEKKSFSECLENSIFKTFRILILVLGIVIVYGVVISLLETILPYVSNYFKLFLELTNALNFVLHKEKTFKWSLLVVSFSGVSIHTQIKSILEDTPINYKYFLNGRLIASALSLIVIVCLK